jgi:hypothetical protein
MITPSYGLTATERVLPRMALDFTTATLDPRVTFTRSGDTATVINSSGNIAPINADLPRFDFDPITLLCKGLLIEEARTNLFLYSAEFDNIYWGKIRSSITANATISPDGASTGDKLVENLDNGTHLIVRTETTTNTSANTWSIYAKASERPSINIVVREGTTFLRSSNATFNLSAGTVGAVSNAGGSSATAAIENAGNGWYRCSLTITLGGVDTNSQALFQLNNGSVSSYQGDGTSGIFIWGAQLEAGAFATSYIPTTTTSLTRNADNVSMTGTNFSDWYNASEGNFLDYGVDPTGVTNSTTAMKAFFDACIADEHPGNIPAGTYLITAGVLAFDNGHVDTPWPIITTDGYEAVIFNRADATDAPMISITNGTAVSAAGKFWQGGALGGITFNQNGQVKAANQHGLLLLGTVGIAFGHMRMNDGGGSCIIIPEKKFSITNPDPYNVNACSFAAAEANRCDGYAFFNDNGVGLTGSTIKYIRAIENVGGAFFGFGAANEIGTISAGSCAGWALGNRTDSAGASQRFLLGVAEFDDMQYGIDMRRVSNSNFGTVRFVHRYNFGPLNPSGGYWPRIAVQVSTNSVVMNNLRIIDRIEAGGTKPDLGQFFDFGNGGGNTLDIQVQRQIIDNASFGFTVSDYYTNFNANSTVQYTDNRGVAVIDTLKNLILLHGHQLLLRFLTVDMALRRIQFNIALN